MDTRMTGILMVLALVSFAIPAFAEEPGIYTDQDLEEYRYPSYDEDTISRKETEIKQWEKEKELKEKIENEIREAENRQEAKNRQGPKKEPKLARESSKDLNGSTQQAVKKKKT